MKMRIKHIAFTALVWSLFAGGNLWAANRAEPVEVNGDQLSVRAEGMALGKLLVAVEKMTGVQFWLDKSMAEEKVFLDFKGLPISEGIEKIIYPLNSALIHDGTGKLRRVIILGRAKDSGMRTPRDGRSDSLKTPRPSRSGEGFFKPKGDSDKSGASRGSPLKKGTVHFHGPPLDKPYSDDGPPDRRDQVMGAHPVDRAYVVDGPPNPQDQKSAGPPDTGSADHSPPADYEEPMDGPPSDREYSVDGPPGWGKEEVMEGPPGAGF